MDAQYIVGSEEKHNIFGRNLGTPARGMRLRTSNKGKSQKADNVVEADDSANDCF